MPSYRFTVRNTDEDDKPLIAEFGNALLARTEAISLLGEILTDADCAFRRNSNLRVDVADDTGLMLYSLMVVGITSPAAPR